MLFIGTKIPAEFSATSPFECGFINKENSRSIFSMHFFLVALLFLIFDVELVLIFPFFHNSAMGATAIELLSLLVFLFVVSYGLAMEWVNSILE